jgi:hypothetical protein
MLNCSLRSRGSRCEAAAFLSHSQTKSVSALSFVQDSGARSCARGIRLLRRRSQREKRLRSLLLSTAARDSPTLAVLLIWAARGVFNCSLRSRGSRCEAAAFLSHSQTKSVSARSVVQASGARSCALGIRRRRRRSQRKERLRSRGSRLRPLPSSLIRRREACLLVRSSRPAARDPGRRGIPCRLARPDPTARSQSPDVPAELVRRA